MVKIERYSEMKKDEWDSFLLRAKNAHFFFRREYLAYHRDRLQDFSLFCYDEKNRLLALLPANLTGNLLVSHGGLTFGGFLVDAHMTAEIMLDLFQAVRDFLRNVGIQRWIYKCIPYIYCTYPAEEDRYALFVNRAKLIRRDVSTAIYLPQRYPYQERRKRAIRKAEKQTLFVEESHDYEAYWKLLQEVLLERHHSEPVHTFQEMQLLAKAFTKNIRLFTAQNSDEILAGTVIFENETIVHTQYLANGVCGRNCGALDLLLHYLITKVYADKMYFDFGISNENEGRFLNVGLISQKEGFGARAVTHDFYEVEV